MGMRTASALQPMHGGPLMCDKELRLHGLCIEKTLRDAAIKGEHYAFVANEGEDKCSKPRLQFDTCMTESKAIKAGTKKDPTTVVHHCRRCLRNTNKICFPNSPLMVRTVISQFFPHREHIDWM